MRILLVDDSDLIRRLISAALRDFGVSDIIEAESGETALAILNRETGIDLVITDWHMPGISGFELLTYLRSMPKYREIPVILSTSESDGASVVAALKAGATNYIIKPYGKQQLAEKILPLIRAKSDSQAAQSGTIGLDGLGAVLQFLMHSGRSGYCELQNDSESGCIYFNAGRIEGAQSTHHSGEEALYHCFFANMKSYRFYEKDVHVPKPSVITASSTALLMEAARRLDIHRSING